MELQTIPEVVARCGHNVTLTCDITSHLSDIALFSWVKKGINKTLCEYDSKHDPENLCESTADTTTKKLTLTLINVMPVHQGTYLCKLRSRSGVNNKSSFVKVQGELAYSFSFFYFFFLSVLFHISKSS